MTIAPPVRPPARPRRPGPTPRRPSAAPPRRSISKARVVAFLLAAVLAFGALGARLVMLQAVRPQQYEAFGERQLVQKIALPASRGAVFDRNGLELALSVRQTTIFADPRQVTDPAGEAVQLAPILGMDEADLQGRLSHAGAFEYLARTVPDDVADKVRTLDLPGVHFMEEPKRFTPGGDLAAAVLGKVGIDDNGLSGLELQYDKTLAGRAGLKVVEQDPTGTPLPDGVRKMVPAVRGDDIVLTIDRSLQFETERALSSEIVAAHAKGGIALVMDSKTGEILALADLEADPAGSTPKPAASNTAATHVYEPGSVNKLITISAALEQGVVRPDDKITVPSSIKVGGSLFHEHESHPTQQWSVTDIMANSSNVGTIEIAQRLGKDSLNKYLHDYGFGQKTDLGFPGESPGIMLDPKQWSGTSLPTMAIGQGVAVTALQMVAAYNTVANGGVYIGPKLVKATLDKDGHEHETAPSPRRRVVSTKTAQQITAMLTQVVKVGTGTNAAIDGYTVAGKTGTARKPIEGGRGYAEGAYVASFAGFVPAERPALTTMVMLDEPTPIYGGLVSAPVFAEISRYGLRQFRIPPPPPASTPLVPTVDANTALAGGEPDPAVVPPPSVPATTLPADPPPPSTTH